MTLPPYRDRTALLGGVLTVGVATFLLAGLQWFLRWLDVTSDLPVLAAFILFIALVHAEAYSQGKEDAEMAWRQLLFDEGVAFERQRMRVQRSDAAKKGKARARARKSP